LKAITASLDRVPATLLLLLATVSIQFGSAIAATLFSIFSPVAVLFLRQTLGSLFLCLLYRRAIAGALRTAPVGILLLGLAMTATSVLFFEALARIPLGIAVTIEFLGPLGVALATSRRPADVLCVLLAAAGIFLLMPAVGSSLDLSGVLFAFGAAVGWAATILASRHLAPRVEGGVGLALAMALSALLLLPVAALPALSGLVRHPEALTAIVGATLLSAAVPMLFEFLALKKITAKTYGVIVSLDPVVATLVGIVTLGERVDLKAGAAMAMISVASAGAALASRNDAKPKIPAAGAQNKQ
jgi:inner membrane transporter RhtA